MGLGDGITSPIVTRWFPGLYAYHKEVLNDLQQLAESADDAVRRHLSGAAGGSFAAIGFARAGLDRKTTPLVVLSGVRKEELSSWLTGPPT